VTSRRPQLDTGDPLATGRSRRPSGRRPRPTGRRSRNAPGRSATGLPAPRAESSASLAGIVGERKRLARRAARSDSANRLVPSTAVKRRRVGMVRSSAHSWAGTGFFSAARRSASGGMAGEKRGTASGQAGRARLGKLSPKGIRAAPRASARMNPSDRIGEGCRRSCVGELKLDRHRAPRWGHHSCTSGFPLALANRMKWSAPIDQRNGARESRGEHPPKRETFRNRRALGVDGTEAGMWAGQRPHGFDDLTDDGCPV